MFNNLTKNEMKGKEQHLECLYLNILLLPVVDAVAAPDDDGGGGR